MTFLVDLDGTLIDIEQKYVQCYKEVFGISLEISNRLWKRRRAGVNLNRIIEELGIPMVNRSNILSNWHRIIESEQMLEFDSLVEGSSKFLERATLENNSICLFTARRNRENLMSQLNNLGILSCFSMIISIEDSPNKELALRRVIDNQDLCLSSRDIVFSDTTEEIMIAHNFGIQACAVLSGLSTRQMFMENEILPNFIIDSIADWPIKTARSGKTPV